MGAGFGACAVPFDVEGASAAAALSALPALPALSALLTLPGLSAFAALSALPILSPFAALSALPVLPALSALPEFPASLLGSCEVGTPASSHTSLSHGTREMQDSLHNRQHLVIPSGCNTWSPLLAVMQDKKSCMGQGTMQHSTAELQAAPRTRWPLWGGLTMQNGQEPR